jgi:hypothetical protein
MLPFDRPTRDLLPLLAIEPENLQDVLEWLRGTSSAEGDGFNALPSGISLQHTFLPTTHSSANLKADAATAGLATTAQETASAAVTNLTVHSGNSPESTPRPVDGDHADKHTSAASAGLKQGGGGGSSGQRSDASGEQRSDSSGAQRNDEPGETRTDIEAEDLRDSLIRQDIRIEQDADVSANLRDGAHVEADLVTTASVDQDGDIAVQFGDAAQLSEGTNYDVDIFDHIDIDQTARIEVHGYAGRVVSRIQYSQQADVDQTASVDIDADEETEPGFVRFSQRTTIDQDTDLDIDLIEKDGALYVELTVRDYASVSQSSDLDIDIDAGERPSVQLWQDFSLNQDIDVDLDIGDEIYGSYVIRVGVSVRQDVDADQDADINAGVNETDIDLDVDGSQVVEIDQELLVRVDFGSV